MSKKSKVKKKKTTYQKYTEYREKMNKDRDKHKYSIQDRTFDYYK